MEYFFLFFALSLFPQGKTNHNNILPAIPKIFKQLSTLLQSLRNNLSDCCLELLPSNRKGSQGSNIHNCFIQMTWTLMGDTSDS